jgi:hypothetical protein
VRAFARQEVLIPATARLDIAHADEWLWTHHEYSGANPVSSRTAAPQLLPERRHKPTRRSHLWLEARFGRRAVSEVEQRR